MIITERQRVLKRAEVLKQERALYIDEFRDLADYIQPSRARFLLSNQFTRPRRSNRIINSRPRHAARVLAAGMMAGLTSPARPWFLLTTPDPDLAKFGRVKRYLYDVQERMRMFFLKSNIYNCFYNVYVDLPTFGIAALHIEADDQDGIRGYNLPIGLFSVANNARMSVDTCYVEKNMTVEQLVQMFGYENVSRQTRALYDRGEYDKWCEVLHAIEPNRNRQYGKLDYTGKAYMSRWLEIKAGDDEGFLRVSGYSKFPVLVPRWEVSGSEVYASACPGMDALGDCKALQLLERRKAQLVDKTSAPPMAGPASLMHKRVSLLPGDFTPVDVTSQGQKLEPAMVIPPQSIPAVQDLIADHENRIGIMYFSDLWLMMSQAAVENREMTAREVMVRHEEKMMQLGPVVERMQDEFLDPCIDITYDILNALGMLPPPPPELAGVELKVEYISILAQAQKLLSTSGVERLAGFAGQTATVRPDVLDLIDWDQMTRHYADSLGVPPEIIAEERRVLEIREARAQQQERQRQLEEAQMATQSVKNLGTTPMNEGSALGELAQRMTGGFAP